MPDNENQMVSLAEAAEIVGVTRGCVYQWLWRGRLHAVRLDGKMMTTPAEVRRTADVMAQNPGGRKRIGERQQALEQGGEERVAV